VFGTFKGCPVIIFKTISSCSLSSLLLSFSNAVCFKRKSCSFFNVSSSNFLYLKQARVKKVKKIIHHYLTYMLCLFFNYLSNSLSEFSWKFWNVSSSDLSSAFVLFFFADTFLSGFSSLIIFVSMSIEDGCSSTSEIESALL
jgi:hypothetical protein